MPCRARVCLGRSVRARSVFRTRAECAFDGVYVALEEQQPEWFAVQTVLRTLAAYGGRRCSILSGKAGCRLHREHGRRGATGGLSGALGEPFSQCSDRTDAYRCAESAEDAKFA